MNMEEQNPRPAVQLEENLKKALTELMMLSLLSEKDRYVGELSAVLREKSNGVLTVVFPYGAIYRLERAGYVCELGSRSAPDGRRRQYFGITEEGRAYLAQLLETYERFSASVAAVLTKGETTHE